MVTRGLSGHKGGDSRAINSLIGEDVGGDEGGGEEDVRDLKDAILKRIKKADRDNHSEG